MHDLDSFRLSSVPLLDGSPNAPERHFMLDLPGRTLNPGLTVFQDRILIAWREGWLPCKLWLGELTDSLEVINRRELRLADRLPGRWKEAAFEDPRLLVHNGCLHLAFTANLHGRYSMGIASL